MSHPRLPGCFIVIATLLACSDDDGGRVDNRPPPAAPDTYSVTLTNVEIDRVADQQDMVIDGLPVDGATVTID